jgi:hypothetical protein
MPNPERGNGRNVSLPDENRPSWRPQDENVTPRIRRTLGEDEERYRYWEDRDWDRDREDYRSERYPGGRGIAEERSHGLGSRDQGYPGTFEERQRERGDDRFSGRGSSYYSQDRGYHPERHAYGGGRGWEGERLGPRGHESRGYESRGYGEPRGYGYGDGDRPNLGTGGPMQHTGYSYGYGGREHPGYQTGGGVFGREHHVAGYRGKGPAGYQRSDERIREIVCEVLTDDDRVDATYIEVVVKGGEVLLSGTVPERHMKRLAEDAIEGISGIKDVQNQIKVQDVMSEKRSRG